MLACCYSVPPGWLVIQSGPSLISNLINGIEKQMSFACYENIHRIVRAWGHVSICVGVEFGKGEKSRTVGPLAHSIMNPFLWFSPFLVQSLKTFALDGCDESGMNR